jgi:cyclic di-GMP phosphodiesterase Gmr
VETFEELAYLQAATSIRHAQGFYFSKPFYLEDMSGAKEFFSESHRSASRSRSALLSVMRT